MKISIDSSSLTKRYAVEPGTWEVQAAISGASALGLSILVVPEVISALNQKLRRGELTAAQYPLAKRQLFQDVSDAMLIDLTVSIEASAIRLLEENVLRALDALQVACALEWGAELFVTSDKR